MKQIVLENRTKEKFEEWSSFCSRLSKSLDLEIIPGGNAFQPCFNAQIELLKIIEPPFRCVKSLMLLKSFIEPYWCVYGMYHAFDGSFEDKNLPKADVRYKSSVIFSEKPEYELYSSKIKDIVSVEHSSAEFLLAKNLFDLKPEVEISLYSDSALCPEPKLYNYIFDALNLDNFHVI